MHTATVSLLKMPEVFAGYRVIDTKGREIGRVTGSSGSRCSSRWG
jgi:hypothetical protein